MLTTLIVLALLFSGVLAGGSVDRLIVQLPARHRIGYLAYADYARASDLGNGLVLYPILAIGGTLLDIAALVEAARTHVGGGVVTPLAVAVGAAAVVLLLTTQAAPTMMRIGKTPNEEPLIAPLVERFVNVSYFRAVFLFAQFGALLWALMAH